MAQSYSKFNYEDIANLGIDIQTKRLFPMVNLAKPSDFLKKTLERNLRKPLGSEKAKSEHIIVPLLTELAEINDNTFTYFSGYSFDVDKANGLKGICDYLLSTEVNTLLIKAPVISIVEAKHENIEVGIPQCIAQMYAAQIFNERHRIAPKPIYGCVTFGFTWQFLLLDGKTVWADTQLYFLNNLPELLGIWQTLIDFYKR